MKKIKLMIFALLTIFFVVGCGPGSVDLNTEIEASKYSYTPPGMGALNIKRTIHFKYKGVAETFDDTGSAATYLSTRTIGTWKVKNNKVIVSNGAEFTGEYEYKDGYLSNSSLTLKKQRK